MPSGKAATPWVADRPVPPLISGLNKSSAPRQARASMNSVVTNAVAVSESALMLFWPEYLAANAGWYWVAAVNW